jgi:ribonuclease HI/ADP-ribose pyrophosphatase YjhB (NUDIX family)
MYKFKAGVFNIILNEKNEVLLVLRPDLKIWNLPGGGLDAGESPWEGALRELTEETGLTGEVDRLVDVSYKGHVHEIVLTFLSKVTGGELTLNDEAMEFGWFAADALPENISQRQATRIKNYFANPNGVKLDDQTVTAEKQSIDAKSLHKLYTDGGSRGNPGDAGIGYVIYDNADMEVAAHGEYIGVETNNVAEYRALIEGLDAALKLGINSLEVYLDSELIVKQLHGEYKVKNEGLKPLFMQVQEVAQSFTQISFTHVKRHLNKRADALVNEALDNMTK